MTDWIEWNWTPEKPYPDTESEAVKVLIMKEGEAGYAWLCKSIFNEKDFKGFKPNKDFFLLNVTHYMEPLS